MLTRTALTLAALVLTPALIACDSKPEPGDVNGTESATEAATEAATEGAATEGATTDEPATEGTDSESTAATEGTEGATTVEATTGDSEHLPADAECNAEVWSRSRVCDGGFQFCTTDFVDYPDHKYFWGACIAEPECQPGETSECTECILDSSNGTPFWIDNCGEDTGTTTPLVLNFGDEPVRYDSSAASFDLGPACGATDWPTATTPWLAIDLDSSGAIEAGRELFGSATKLRRGGLADNGFTALAELDQDRDGRISASDPAFSRLMLWSDHNADRRSTSFELTPVSAAGIVAIGLTYRNDSRCDTRSNCEIERAAFTYRDALGRERVGEVIDVHLSCQ